MSRSGSSSRKAAATSLLGEIADAAPPDNSTVRRWIARIDALQAQVDREKKARLVAEQRLERARSEPRTHLVIGDSHADLLREPNDRYTWLGRMIADLKPDVVVDIGDFADMPSLCKYEKPGGRELEGRRYQDDVESAIDARRRIQAELPKGYKPQLEAIIGNHENRISQAVNLDIRWENKIHLKDLGAEDFNWNVTPFMVPRFIDGIGYCHYYTRQNTQIAIAGKYMAAHLLAENHLTSVVGHSHCKHMHQARRSDGRKLTAMSVGCYFERELDYAGRGSNEGYWRGIIVLKDVRDGEIGGVVEYPLEEVRRRWR
jgi:hypothetical protein